MKKFWTASENILSMKPTYFQKNTNPSTRTNPSVVCLLALQPNPFLHKIMWKIKAMSLDESEKISRNKNIKCHLLSSRL